MEQLSLVAPGKSWGPTNTWRRCGGRSNQKLGATSAGGMPCPTKALKYEMGKMSWLTLVDPEV